MHDETFPQSQESPERRTARAVEALEYEEKAGLGFRRRKVGERAGNPYGSPEQYDVNAPVTGGQVLGSYLSAMAIILGAGAIIYKPLLLGSAAGLLALLGTIGGSNDRVTRLGVIVSCTGFSLGMLIAILTDAKIF